MSIPSQKKPNTGALRWIAGLMGRMDRHMASVVPGLAAAMAPKAMPKCIPFHKRPGHVNKPLGKTARKHALRAERKADNATVPKFAAERVRRQAAHPLCDAGGKAYTLTGRNTLVSSGPNPWDTEEWIPGRRMWVAGLSNDQRRPA